MLAIAAVHPDDSGLVTKGVGIRVRSTECLGPIRGESLDMPGMETVAEGMADYVVGHHPTMPGGVETVQAVVSAPGLEDSKHVSIMTILAGSCKTTMADDDFSRNNAIGVHGLGSTQYRKLSSILLDLWLCEQHGSLFSVRLRSAWARGIRLCVAALWGSAGLPPSPRPDRR